MRRSLGKTRTSKPTMIAKNAEKVNVIETTIIIFTFYYEYTLLIKILKKKLKGRFA